MAEQTTNQYKPLFQLQILHHYWLDQGATVFDLMPNQQQRDIRLLSYDVRQVLTVAPTAATRKALAGLGGIYKESSLGCIVAVANDTVVPADAVFEFTVTVQDFSFNNYTALTLPQQKTYEIYYEPEKTVYRYKENVPLLSNLTGTSRMTAAGKALFLSKEYPALAADDQVEALVLDGGGLSQLTGDQPGAALQQLNPVATDLPVFLHQGDLPDIVPPAGLTGAPKRGVRLSDDMPDTIYAVISLSAVRSGDFSFVDSNGKAKAAYPVFQMRLKNRSTIWKYFDKNTGILISAEAQPLPLTRFGNAGSKQKPAQGFVKAVKTGGKISQLFSEIFV
jgi:hypothetical protein